MADVSGETFADQAAAPPRHQSGRSVWVFLATGRFAMETTFLGYWISLDFLGFSRPNLAFSKGYTGFSLENFSSRFFPH
jgi:hypothetical protein